MFEAGKVKFLIKNKPQLCGFYRILQDQSVENFVGHNCLKLNIKGISVWLFLHHFTNLLKLFALIFILCYFKNLFFQISIQLRIADLELLSPKDTSNIKEFETINRQKLKWKVWTKRNFEFCYKGSVSCEKKTCTEN